jgi:antagonist of KipI
MALRLLTPAPLTTIQDLGRVGYQHLGIPVSGAMDELALRGANRLAGNADDAAAIELGFGGAVFEAEADLCLGLTGVGVRGQVQGRPIPAWMTIFVRRGQLVEVVMEPGAGSWAYVAVAGGVAVPPVLGARATYTRARFGGWGGVPLTAGAVLEIGTPTQRAGPPPGATIPREGRPPYSPHPTLAALHGPQAEQFDAATFWGAPYTLTRDLDRMGYRLGGPPLTARNAGELLSEGVTLGAVQVPPDGQPLVMMADRPTTGGYAKVAMVARAEVGCLAQCAPGAQVRFRPIASAEAQALYRARVAALQVVWGGVEPF